MEPPIDQDGREVIPPPDPPDEVFFVCNGVDGDDGELRVLPDRLVPLDLLAPLVCPVCPVLPASTS